jgi:SAM-dependent methyltransferase
MLSMGMDTKSERPVSLDADTLILDHVATYYAARLKQHGATPRGVDWNSAQSHELRHRQFLRLLEGHPESSVLDLGCGFGDFFRFLRQSGHRGGFIGYDVEASMIAEAVRLHGSADDRSWHVGAKPAEAVDFAIASGVFNVKGDIGSDVWAGYVADTIDVLARAGRRGFAFNMLSLSSDAERRRPDLYYADPAGTLAECLRRFGRSVALLQDYGLWEFTVVVRHQV